MSLALGLFTAIAPIAVPHPAQDARWELAPVSAVIGEPVTARLVVEHAADARPDLGEVELGLDDSWVVLEAGRPGFGSAALPDGTRSERTWSAMSLEPGARAWPQVLVELGDGTSATAPAATVEVTAELAPDEDAPRPLPGFHPIPERAGPLRPPHIALALLGGLLAAVGWWWTTRRTGIARAAEEEDELTRLAHLAPADWDAPGAAREYAWGLATILRGAAHRGLDEDRQGLSEEELVAALRAGDRAAASERIDELEALLAECARIKYAGEQPTRFALEGLGRRAEVWLRAVAESEAEVTA